MDFPPSKRLKGQQVTAAPDPFDDDIDFTQDELEQIDIMASQAVTAAGSKRTIGSVLAEETSRAPARAARKTFAIGNSSSSDAFNSKEENRNAGGHSSKDVDDLYYKHLEEQQADLKRKLKEVEDEILMKNGEIRVLRDSLKLANQEKAQQLQAQAALEKDKTLTQSEREKELHRKVQSLQSELHFKEAEMNEMRGKLQSAERGGKQSGTPARRSIQSPVSRSFMTKENFSSEIVSKKTSPVKKDPSSDDGKPAQSRPLLPESPLWARSAGSEGCVLLKLLLQQPLDPSSLGVCHLMCLSPDALPNALSQHGFSSPSSLSTSSSSSGELRSLPCPQSRFQQLQNLASSALSGLALPHADCSLRSCPSALHFLPLLTFHINTYCHSLASSENPAKPSLLSGSSDSSLASSLEESLIGQEELALAALRALHHILCYSTEAINAVLEDVVQSAVSEQMQIPVFKRILQLADPAFSSTAGHKEALVSVSLKALCVLGERAQETQILRLQTVMSSQVLSKCLTLESSCRTVHQCVRFLNFIVCNEAVATKLCSHEYPCPFLKIFQYVTSRPDKSASEDSWSRVELEVIRLLSKLFTQKMGTWAALCESSCQCINEVVRTVVVVLHRQWLKTKGRGSQTLSNVTRMSPGFQVLREALMFLHWLLLKDSSFSEHCLDVLHMYDQVIPAIRDTFRTAPDLTESEELALDEICRSETEYVEDMEIETGS